MKPEIYTGDRIFTECFWGFHSRIDIGDNVIALDPEGDCVIKEVTHLPGDYVEHIKRTLGPTEYWLEGHSPHSVDSREHGPFTKESIIARMISGWE